MSIGVMRCNKEGCSGFVRYEDADYDIRGSILNGSYIVDDDLECNICGRKFKAVVAYIFIHEDEKTGDIEKLESACITEYEDREEIDDCQYCCGDVDSRDYLLTDGCDGIYIDGNGNLVGDDNFDFEEKKINYCPICGKKQI